MKSESPVTAQHDRIRQLCQHLARTEGPIEPWHKKWKAASKDEGWDGMGNRTATKRKLRFIFAFHLAD